MKPTDKQIVEWARKAQVANAWDINWFDPYYACFAKLVAAAEREACAKFIEQEYVRQFDEPWRDNLAKAIRARREQ